MWWHLVRQSVVVAHILCRVAVSSVVVFLYHSLEEFVVDINILCDKFIQCLDYLSVKGNLVLHVFLESLSVHDY